MFMPSPRTIICPTQSLPRPYEACFSFHEKKFFLKKNIIFVWELYILSLMSDSYSLIRILSNGHNKVKYRQQAHLPKSHRPQHSLSELHSVVKRQDYKTLINIFERTLRGVIKSTYVRLHTGTRRYLYMNHSKSIFTQGKASTAY